MSTANLRRRIADHSFWWHSLDLGNGIVTPGHKPVSVLEEELAALQLPNLHGKTVLDIGAWDGYFSFAAERRGASRVLALDYYVWATDPAANKETPRDLPAPSSPGGSATGRPHWDPVNLPGKRGFDLAREVLGSHVESVFGDVLTLDATVIGEFDVVLLLGVLYHTRHPVEMLERVASLTRGTMVLETESFSLPGYDDMMLGQFFETDELEGDASNWWSLTESAIAGMCRSSGFASVHFLSPYHTYPPAPNGLRRHRALAHVTKSPDSRRPI